MKTLLVIIAILVVGGGAGLLAQNSLPGDILYPVKIHVSENREAAFSLSQSAKIELAEKLAGQRLAEAEQLAVKNRLTADTAATIQAGFKKQAAVVQKATKNFDTEMNIRMAAEINSGFEGELRAHVDVLTSLKAKKTDEAVFLVTVSDAVKSAIDSATASRVTAESKIMATDQNESDLKARAESARNAAETKVSEAKKILDTNKSTDETLNTETQAEFHAAENQLADGKARLETQAYTAAFVLFQQSQRSAQEVGERFRAVTSLGISLH